MHTDFHIGGKLKLSLSYPPGAARAQIGITTDGIEVAVQTGSFEWKTDQSGDFLPGMILYSGLLATIKFTMIRWDSIQLERLLSVPLSQSPKNSNTTEVGRPFFSGERQITNSTGLPSLYIKGSKVRGMRREESYTFHSVRPINSSTFTIGMRITRMEIELQAVPDDQIMRGNLYSF